MRWWGRSAGRSGRRCCWGASLLGLLVAAARSAHGAYVPIRTFANPNPSADYFGTALATFGNDLLIGAPLTAGSSGIVFRFNLATGSLIQAYPTPHPGTLDLFGSSVSVVPAGIAVGAPLDDLGAPGIGMVYVLDPATGAVLRALNRSAYVSGLFGWATAPVGSDVVVGQAGAVEAAIRFDPTTGAPVRAFLDPSEESFALSVTSRSGDVLTRSLNGVLHFDGDTGALLRVDAGGGTALATLGTDVLVGDGSPVARLSGGTGDPVQTYVDPNPAMPWFGVAVAGGGGKVLVGAPGMGGSGAAGAAYLFDGDSGLVEETFANPDPGRFAFGRTVLLVGRSVVVAAPGDAAGPGAVYLFTPCGDGALDPGEQCDDGNTASGDGCSPTCVPEAGSTTTTTTTTTITTSTTTTSLPPPLAIPQPPTQMVLVGDEVVLDAHASVDRLAQTPTYQWSLVSQPPASTAQLAGAATGVASFTADQPGEYAIALTVSAGGRTSSPAVATVLAVATSSLGIAIAAPSSGATVPENRVQVRGTVTGPPDVGVSVNGIAASVRDGIFVADAIPLVPGDNALVASATTAGGTTRSAGVRVTSGGLAPVLSLRALQRSIVVPLRTAFEYELGTSAPIEQLEMDFDGDGIVDFVTTDPAETLEHVYDMPGLFAARLVVTAGGQPYAGEAIVEAHDFATMDARFHAIWTGVHGALLGGNVAGALPLVNVDARERFRAVWTALLPQMPTMFASYSPLQPYRIGQHSADYFVTRTLNGETRIFFVAFDRGDDGVWRLDGM
ncbi:MAG: hypothetical protein U0807_14165 [Candidatus Binatia bacterium]